METQTKPELFRMHLRLKSKPNLTGWTEPVIHRKSMMTTLENSDALYSPIHKAAVWPAAVQNVVWRSFCTAVFFDILGITSIRGKPVERP